MAQKLTLGRNWYVNNKRSKRAHLVLGGLRPRVIRVDRLVGDVEKHRPGWGRLDQELDAGKEEIGSQSGQRRGGKSISSDDVRRTFCKEERGHEKEMRKKACWVSS